MHCFLRDVQSSPGHPVHPVRSGMPLCDEVPSASVLFVGAVAALCPVRYGGGTSRMGRDFCVFTVPPATGCSVLFDTGLFGRLEAPFFAGCHIPSGTVRFGFWHGGFNNRVERDVLWALSSRVIQDDISCFQRYGVPKGAGRMQMRFRQYRPVCYGSVRSGVVPYSAGCGGMMMSRR